MAFFKRGNARIYYEDTGSGEPLIAIHGLIENTTYWSLSGVSDTLAQNFRFISMDMRGHGRTVVEGEPSGFDDETMGDDLIALADHLKLERFHVLSHSTGGFISVRRAMKAGPRFASLVLTDTGSMTSVVPGELEKIRKFHDNFAKSFEMITWEQMFKALRINPGPFFRGIGESGNSEELFRIAMKMVEINDRSVIASFVRSFYTDPDPRVDGLRKISCPVLIIYGEKDDLFIQSSKLMAKEIPGAEIVEYPGVGHMTAIESPERLAADVIGFCKRHPVI
jgi:pimeloyl-ACP methyl ester carboxylesterase